MPSIITWLIHQFLTKDQHEYSLLSLRLWVIFIATFQVIWFWWANVFFLLLLPGWVKMNNCFFLRSLRPLRILWENISSFLPFSHKSYIYHYQPSSPHASSLSFLSHYELEWTILVGGEGHTHRVLEMGWFVRPSLVWGSCWGVRWGHLSERSIALVDWGPPGLG